MVAVKEVRRFLDLRETLFAFEDEVFVVCPRCKRRAVLMGPLAVNSETHRIERIRELVCPHCGLNRVGGRARVPSEHYSMQEMPELELWLQTPCCGRVFWALNRRHLETLEEFVRADLREQHSNPRNHARRCSFITRLPKWVIVAKHRDAVLKAVERLRRKLPPT